MDSPIWERQENETPKRWKAFQVYRDMGADRSLAKVAIALGKPPGYKRPLEYWATQHNWVERCREYDLYLDRLNRSFRETEKRMEYASRTEAYREESERIGAAMVATMKVENWGCSAQFEPTI
ncbi:hypothetical protein B4U84_00090 [Westiellopsis prolifica IICB1]|nr:hypothetical protein B4U84_00090 [Westiellopsis prolifica IICB1]